MNEREWQFLSSLVAYVRALAIAIPDPATSREMTKLGNELYHDLMGLEVEQGK